MNEIMTRLLDLCYEHDYAVFQSTKRRLKTMEKCNGVPEIVRFRNVLGDNCIPWIWYKSKVVFCMYGMIFEVSQVDYPCEKPLSIAVYSPAIMISSMMEGFNADEIIPYIDTKIGGL